MADHVPAKAFDSLFKMDSRSLSVLNANMIKSISGQKQQEWRIKFRPPSLARVRALKIPCQNEASEK